jgi:hypothetical protein
MKILLHCLLLIIICCGCDNFDRERIRKGVVSKKRYQEPYARQNESYYVTIQGFGKSGNFCETEWMVSKEEHDQIKIGENMELPDY